MASSTPGKFAVVVGVDDYLQDEILDLRFCESDARAFSDTLTRYCGYPTSNVFTLLGEDATFEEVFKIIRSFSDERLYRDVDTVVFYFSGHGVARDGKNYLVPWDGSATPDLIASRNLPMEWLTEQLQNCMFERQVLFIDACRNRLTDQEKGSDSLGLAAQHLVDENARGMKILYGTEFGNVSWEDPDLGHGLFTMALLAGLRGGAADDEGRIRVSDIEEFVLAYMADYSRRNPSRVQLPQLDGAGSSSILFAVVSPEGQELVAKPILESREEIIAGNLEIANFTVQSFKGGDTTLSELIGSCDLLFLRFWQYD